MLVLVLASADATAAAAAPAAGAAKLACLCFTSPAAAAAPAAVVVRNKSQKYYSLARSPLRLPGSADMSNSTSSWDESLGKNADGSLKDLPTLECFRGEQTAPTPNISQDMITRHYCDAYMGMGQNLLLHIITIFVAINIH